ncbi:unnamed protein product [Candida verbasci]|uniref:N-acetyltransferase ECO1 n=1 Tax=Candida verbasci TaxID=1227364 RepID=A0A9W4XBV1_9ASCO|nr:unnamed protein product [Candida verbasci]
MSKKVQSIFILPNNDKLTTCKTCEMTYNQSINNEVKIHNKYHLKFTNGLNWPHSLIDKTLDTITIVDKKVKSTNHKSIISKEMKLAKVISIDKMNKNQVLKTESLLRMCNLELNATPDSKQWQKFQYQSSKAFILVIDKKAIGICTTDEIKPIDSRWMIYKTQQIVTDKEIKNVKIGISRIWIAPKWRGFGLAKKLLEIVLKYSIYGVVLNKNQIAFSQPSYSGCQLAKSFNGVLHKSGEVLIPVYLEG